MFGDLELTEWAHCQCGMMWAGRSGTARFPGRYFIKCPQDVLIAGSGAREAGCGAWSWLDQRHPNIYYDNRVLKFLCCKQPVSEWAEDVYHDPEVCGGYRTPAASPGRGASPVAPHTVSPVATRRPMVLTEERMAMNVARSKSVREAITGTTGPGTVAFAVAEHEDVEDLPDYAYLDTERQSRDDVKRRRQGGTRPAGPPAMTVGQQYNHIPVHEQSGDMSRWSAVTVYVNGNLAFPASALVHPGGTVGECYDIGTIDALAKLCGSTANNHAMLQNASLVHNIDSSAFPPSGDPDTMAEFLSPFTGGMPANDDPMGDDILAVLLRKIKVGVTAGSTMFETARNIVTHVGSTPGGIVPGIKTYLRMFSFPAATPFLHQAFGVRLDGGTHDSTTKSAEADRLWQLFLSTLNFPQYYLEAERKAENPGLNTAVGANNKPLNPIFVLQFYPGPVCDFLKTGKFSEAAVLHAGQQVESIPSAAQIVTFQDIVNKPASKFNRKLTAFPVGGKSYSRFFSSVSGNPQKKLMDNLQDVLLRGGLGAALRSTNAGTANAATLLIHCKSINGDNMQIVDTAEDVAANIYIVARRLGWFTQTCTAECIEDTTRLWCKCGRCPVFAMPDGWSPSVGLSMHSRNKIHGFWTVLLNMPDVLGGGAITIA